MMTTAAVQILKSIRPILDQLGHVCDGLNSEGFHAGLRLVNQQIDVLTGVRQSALVLLGEIADADSDEARQFLTDIETADAQLAIFESIRDTVTKTLGHLTAAAERALGTLNGKQAN